MELKRLLGLRKGNIISIVGAGGKTSLLNSIAQEFRKTSRVLVTTTTKIYMPKKIHYDFLIIGKDSYGDLSKNNGIYVYGNYVSDENKIIGPSKACIENKILYFDYILIEADGAKEKSIKGWNDNEPVVISKTNKTIGVISIDVIGKVINDKNIHRVKEFTDVTHSKIDEVISVQHLNSLVFHSKGLFKDSKGERILFINKVEEYEKMKLANELLKCILNKNKGYVSKVIIGSLKNKKYQLIKI